jgi:hypothetical protein
MTLRARSFVGSWGVAGLVSFVVAVVFVSPAVAGPIDLGVWYEFSFTDPGVGAAGCDPADPAGGFCIPSSGTPTTFLDAPPWTFVAPALGALLTVTDAFLSGDQFEILDFGLPLGFTSAPAPGIDCGDDPVPCLATPGVSTGAFLLAAGAHSLTIAPLLAPDGGGAGYLLVTSVIPEPGTWSLLVVGLLALAFHRHKSLRRAA